MRIAGINIPDNKRVHIALTYIYGIGNKVSQDILASTKIKDKLAKELTAEEVNRIQEFIEKNHKIEGTLRQILKQNIQRLKEIQSYRGIRHMKRLPVRGQTTKTNSRTVRGNVRKTAGSGKRKVDLK
ncbi:MAG TPA: 30S ribosomal protein S13 [Candidatus Paceibacterota bacterium]